MASLRRGCYDQGRTQGDLRSGLTALESFSGPMGLSELTTVLTDWYRIQELVGKTA